MQATDNLDISLALLISQVGSNDEFVILLNNK
jgi:hypothetical protein